MQTGSTQEFRVQAVAQLSLYLRSLRKAQHLTQHELGRKIGVTGARISDIERDPGAVGLAQLLRILHVLGARMVIELAEPATDKKSGRSPARGEW